MLAWRAAFGDDPSAILLLKIRTCKRTRIVLEEVRDLAGENVRILDQELSDDDLVRLQKSCDVYLSLHRSEGYGLNIAECLTIGKPVLATHWSANAEYGPAYETYHPVDFKLVPYSDWMFHYEESRFSWADPNPQAAAQLLRKIRSGWA